MRRSTIRRPLTLRQRVFDRDRGKCVACGLRAQKIRQWAATSDGWSQAFRRWEQRMIRRGRFGYVMPERRQSMWEADHIHAKSDGGPDHLSNLRTLCFWCHKRRSAVQTSVRAAARSGVAQ